MLAAAPSSFHTIRYVAHGAIYILYQLIFLRAKKRLLPVVEVPIDRIAAMPRKVCHVHMSYLLL